MAKQKPVPQTIPSFLVFTLFMTGASILIIEVVGARLLSPHFGVGLFVWSALITITLTALSIGYWYGGRVADRKPEASSLYRIILISGLLTLVVPPIAPHLLRITMTWGIRWGTLLSATFLFGPALFFLGMVSPYAVRLYTEEIEHLGRRVGHLYAISTVGSCSGSLVTGFFLIPTLGVSNIFYLTAGILIGLWILQMAIQKSLSLKTVGIPVALFVGTLFLPHTPSAAKKGTLIVNETESLYGHLSVQDTGDHRWLMIDGAPNSGIDKRTGYPLTAYSYHLEILRYIQPKAQSLLLVGLGGASMANRFQSFGVTVDVVEIDSDVVDLAKTYFHYKPNGEVAIQDARQFILSTQNHYDLVILDVFTGDLAPFHLFSQEALQETKGIMTPEGVLGINYIGFIEGPDARVPRSVVKTLETIFQNVAVHFPSDAKTLGNMIILASDAPLTLRKNLSEEPIPEVRRLLTHFYDHPVDLSDQNQIFSGNAPAIVLTDNYNPIQLWNAHASEEWRKQIWQVFGSNPHIPQLLSNFIDNLHFSDFFVVADATHLNGRI